jgi:hypothetical protein
VLLRARKMNRKITELQSQLELLSQQHPNREGFAEAHSYLGLHLSLAKELKKTSPSRAIEHYKLAESCQSSIGTFATGSGEGLASMGALYEIMADRAELEERLAYKSKRTKDRIQHLQEALKIWKEIKADPNLDDLLPQKNIEPLEEQLAAWIGESS